MPTHLLIAPMLALAAGGALAADIEARFAEGRYAPAALSARVGDVLIVRNDDATEHAVFVPTVGHAVDLGVQKPGETRRLVLRKAGRLALECAVHDGLSLALDVAP